MEEITDSTRTEVVPTGKPLSQVSVSGYTIESFNDFLIYHFFVLHDGFIDCLLCFTGYFSPEA